MKFSKKLKKVKKQLCIYFKSQSDLKWVAIRHLVHHLNNTHWKTIFSLLFFFFAIILLNATVQLISFWFHELFIGSQQVPSWESWVPGEAARCGGVIQIMLCSKLAPCFFSVPPRCSKNSVTVPKLKLSACESLKSRALKSCVASFGS